MNNAEAPLMFIIGSLTLLVFVVFLVLIVIEYRKRQVRHITEKLEIKHQYQNEVLQTQLEVQEQSFKYISEEIHDNVAQTLSLARLKLFKTAGKMADAPLKESIESGAELVGNALTDLRNLSHLLNGGLVSRLPLKESIDKELHYVGGVKEVQAQLFITGSPYEPNPEKKLLIFRIVQEAINNAIKHGQAKEINISLAYQPDMLQVIIADNGKGFDARAIGDSKGLGLHNILVRARLLGNIDIASEPGKGTTITLKVTIYE
jgi:two-component system NarL family sensor kinase